MERRGRLLTGPPISKTILPLQDGRWILTPHAFALHVKRLCVWIVPIRVAFPSTSVEDRSNDGICDCPRLLVPNQQRMSGGHTAGCWWSKTCGQWQCITPHHFSSVSQYKNAHILQPEPVVFNLGSVAKDKKRP